MEQDDKTYLEEIDLITFNVINNTPLPYNKWLEDQKTPPWHDMSTCSICQDQLKTLKQPVSVCKHELSQLTPDYKKDTYECECGIVLTGQYLTLKYRDTGLKQDPKQDSKPYDEGVVLLQKRIEVLEIELRRSRVEQDNLKGLWLAASAFVSVMYNSTDETSDEHIEECMNILAVAVDNCRRSAFI